MGLFDNLFRRKKENAPPSGGALDCIDSVEDESVTEWDCQYSQSIYNRNLIGVLVYEIECVPDDGIARQKELFLGEFIEMTEGRMVLGARIKDESEGYFECRKCLSLSYSGYGESFFVEARIVKATGADNAAASARGNSSREAARAGDAGLSGEKWDNYIIEVILCAEPVRHRRRYGRVAIEWNVYYSVKPGGQDNVGADGAYSDAGEEAGYCVTKTIDISEGGFKSIVEDRIEKNTIIDCIVEVDNNTKSKGALLGRVIRCDHMVDNIEMYEITVQFIVMDNSVKDFLVSNINNKHPGAVDAEAKITVTSDCLEALIELSPPRNNGSDLTFDALCARLAIEGVIYGIDNDALKTLSEKPYYNLETVVARGVPPTHGDDAVLTYYVEMNPVLTPKEYEDGTVDFKDIGLIPQVYKDDILVEKTMSTQGTHGTCVTGEVFEAKPGRDKKLPAGANTVANETGTALMAGIDGCISIIDDKINVFDTYVVEGDVQYETGNINHNGIVIVKGDVRYGFAVDATGDIVIHGTVESAVISAGGSLVVQGGCVGEENVVETGGNVAVKFIDGGTFNIRGDLKTTYIINSTIKCSGSIEMIGNGIIRNSHVVAQTDINAKSIGSVRAAADKTVVEVGNDPELLNRFMSVTKKLEQIDKDRESFETSIRALTIRKYRQELSAEKLDALEKSKVLVKQLSAQHADMSDDYNAMKEQINALGYGTIRVRNIAYEGLRIIIGTSTLVLKDSVKAVKFTRNEDGITYSPLF